MLDGGPSRREEKTAERLLPRRFLADPALQGVLARRLSARNRLGMRSFAPGSFPLRSLSQHPQPDVVPLYTPSTREGAVAVRPAEGIPAQLPDLVERRGPQLIQVQREARSHDGPVVGPADKLYGCGIGIDLPVVHLDAPAEAQGPHQGLGLDARSDDLEERIQPVWDIGAVRALRSVEVDPTGLAPSLVLLRVGPEHRRDLRLAVRVELAANSSSQTR